jgi:hypothetical protein
VELLPGFHYPAFRLFIIGVGLLVALLLYLLVTHTRVGMQVRAGASNREMALAMGTNVRRLFTAVFAWAPRCARVAGGMLGPLLAVQVGMGESILILAFVVIVIGGIGSIRGAFLGACSSAWWTPLGRTLIPLLFGHLMGPAAASNAGPAVASILIYVLMAAVLFLETAGPVPCPRLMPSPMQPIERPARAQHPLDHGLHLRWSLPLLVLLALFPLIAHGLGEDFFMWRGQPRADLCPGSHQPESDPGLWRHGEFWPRCVCRHSAPTPWAS